MRTSFIAIACLMASVCQVVCGSSLAHATEDVLQAALPIDAPVSFQAVHRLSFALNDTQHVFVGAAKMFGDKFVDSQGLHGDYFYFMSEDLALDLSAAFFWGARSGEADALDSAGFSPRTFDPSFIGQGGVFYSPIYGKFAIGDHILHVRLGGVLGIHAAREEKIGSWDTEAASPDSKLAIGPVVGLKMLLPVSDRLELSLSSTYLLHGQPDPEIRGMKHLWLHTAGIGISL